MPQQEFSQLAVSEIVGIEDVVLAYGSPGAKENLVQVKDQCKGKDCHDGASAVPRLVETQLHQKSIRGTAFDIYGGNIRRTSAPLATALAGKIALTARATIPYSRCRGAATIQFPRKQRQGLAAAVRTRIRPAKLVATVAFAGLALLGVLSVWILWSAPPYGALILGIYVAVWMSAILISVAVAVIAQVAMRKRHGVFSHLREEITANVKGGEIRVRR